MVDSVSGRLCFVSGVYHVIFFHIKISVATLQLSHSHYYLVPYNPNNLEVSPPKNRSLKISF